MKISYILQLKDFFIMFGAGFVVGIIYGLINIVNLNKKHQIITNIIDFIFVIFSSTSLLLLINLINLGEFRLFLILGYILGIICERITLGKIFAKGYKFVYTTIKVSFNKFKETQIGKVIFK